MPAVVWRDSLYSPDCAHRSPGVSCCDGLTAGRKDGATGEQRRQACAARAYGAYSRHGSWCGWAGWRHAAERRHLACCLQTCRVAFFCVKQLRKPFMEAAVLVAWRWRGKRRGKEGCAIRAAQAFRSALFLLAQPLSQGGGHVQAPSAPLPQHRACAYPHVGRLRQLLLWRLGGRAACGDTGSHHRSAVSVPLVLPAGGRLSLGDAVAQQRSLSWPATRLPSSHGQWRATWAAAWKR